VPIVSISHFKLIVLRTTRVHLHLERTSASVTRPRQTNSCPSEFISVQRVRKLCGKGPTVTRSLRRKVNSASSGIIEVEHLIDGHVVRMMWHTRVSLEYLSNALE